MDTSLEPSVRHVVAANYEDKRFVSLRPSPILSGAGQFHFSQLHLWNISPFNSSDSIQPFVSFCLAVIGYMNERCLGAAAPIGAVTAGGDESVESTVPGQHELAVFQFVRYGQQRL